MKIPAILALATLLASAPAFAAESVPFPQAEPIRTAAVKIKVRKSYLSRQDMMEKNGEAVCEITGEIPVYAPADPSKFVRLHGNFHCDTLQDGKNVRVQVSASVNYDDAKGEEPAKKNLTAMTFVTFLDNWDVYVSQPAYVATADLDTKNLELYLNSGTYDLAEIKSGTPAYTVSITANDSK